MNRYFKLCNWNRNYCFNGWGSIATGGAAVAGGAAVGVGCSSGGYITFVETSAATADALGLACWFLS